MNIRDGMDKNYGGGKIMENIKDELRTPIVLVGMMGAGKSHVGSALARQLDLEFFDSDKLVEERAGCSVSEIFERFGEEKFRESEKNVILNLLNGPPCVVATGGGAIANEETLHAIKEKSLSVWLNPDIDILVERVDGRGGRPLLDGQSPKEKLSELLDKRKAMYAQADITLDIHEDNKAETMKRLIKLLSEQLNSARF